MKILEAAKPVSPPPKPTDPWIGMAFRCPNCSIVAEWQAEDYDRAELSGWGDRLNLYYISCPNNLCNELIYLTKDVENKPYFVDYNRRDITRRSP